MAFRSETRPVNRLRLDRHRQAEEDRQSNPERAEDLDERPDRDSSAAPRSAPAACVAPSPASPTSDAAARIIASGFAMFLPNSDGAVPCAASAMITHGVYSSSRATTSDSDPAIEPNSGSTRSERM